MATGGGDLHESIGSEAPGSEELAEVVCDPCKEDGELHKTVGMCIDCQEYLCQRCLGAHKISRPSRNHKFLDNEALLQRKVSKTKDSCTEMCPVHNDKVVKYYCTHHCQLGCHVCITLNHRQCDNVTYIPEAAKSLANNEEYKQVESMLTSVVELSEKVYAGKKTKIKSLEKDCSYAVQMIKGLREAIDISLDKDEADLLQECETLKLEEAESLSSSVFILEQVQSELQSLTATRDSYQYDQQDCQLYTAMMKTKNNIKLAEEKIMETEEQQSSNKTKIGLDPNINVIHKLTAPQALGNISRYDPLDLTTNRMDKNFVVEKIIVSVIKMKTIDRQTEPTALVETADMTDPKTIVETADTTDPKTIVKTADTTRSTATHELKVKCRNDEHTCNITGLVVLSDNKLVVIDSDFLRSNNTVKLVDVQRDKIIAQLTLSSMPRAVAIITNYQVAVTLPYGQKIKIVKVKATDLTVDRTLAVDGRCWGIDFKDDQLCVSFVNPDQVKVLTLQGNVLHTIYTENRKGLFSVFTRRLFNGPYYVAFSGDNESLYVSNFERNNVVNVKFDGTVLCTYTDSELKKPTGLLSDSRGNVYVCGWSFNNIYRISPGDKKMHVLLTGADGLYMPRAISYNEAEHKMYVGMHSRNVVKVIPVPNTW